MPSTIAVQQHPADTSDQHVPLRWPDYAVPHQVPGVFRPRSVRFDSAMAARRAGPAHHHQIRWRVRLRERRPADAARAPMLQVVLTRLHRAAAHHDAPPSETIQKSN
ncbi:hypothetical protein Acsp04_62750 [Actinomadura sp. NBRC 104425]|nr:hypothetical protein Acsp04_62750 [Actinomadura sp. NBRC 104425]